MPTDVIGGKTVLDSGKSVSPRVTVVDYGLGNLFSLERAFQCVGGEVQITLEPRQISEASLLVLPGVGAFGDGMAKLKERELLEPVMAFARSGRPLLGICLGMQLLFTESEEFGLHRGLDLIPGRVVRIKEKGIQGERVKVPHYGWNSLLLGPQRTHWSGTILGGLNTGEFVYFVHSFAAFPTNYSFVAADVSYGQHRYTAVIEDGNILGCQFHPEKSGEAGLKILDNFLRMAN